MKTIYKYIAVFVALIGAYLLFGAGAYWMPDSTVRHHVAKTVERGDLASDQPRAFLPQEQCRMDNFTDALILNQAYVMREEGFLSGLMLLPRWWGPELPFEVLRAGVDGREMPLTHYGRYWHGNTFLSRYLLVAYDYISIRMLLYIVSSLLLLWCMVLLWRKEGWQTAVAMMFGLLSCYMFMMQFSMQFVMVLVLALAGIIAVARGCKGSMAFFVIGSLTCYFDLLTAPMLTLGLMLVAQAALAEEKGFWQGWWRSLRSALLWAIGYVGTWVTKWILATLLTSENVIADGISNTANRSGIDDFGRWDAVMANLEMLPWKYIVVVVIALVVLAAVWFNAKGWRRAVQILPIALLPWVWYFFAANHSYWHYWFTFRAQAVSLAAVLLALMCMVDWDRVKCFKLRK